MDFSIVNWNIGGAKYLAQKEEKRKETRADLYKDLEYLIARKHPDIVTLQEIVRFGKSDADYEDIINLKDLADIKKEYYYYSFPLIDSYRLSSQSKWNKVRSEGGWPRDTYFAQGNAFLFKKDLPHYPVWDLSYSSALVTDDVFNWNEVPGNDEDKIKEVLSKRYDIEWVKNAKIEKTDDGKEIKVTNNGKSLSLRLNDNNNEVDFENNNNRDIKFIAKTEKDKLNIYVKDMDRHFIEQVSLESGLYFGDRNTEPRAALVAHFIKEIEGDPKPLDIFIVNTHLTTITNEREGIPDVDLEATRLRKIQIDTIFRGIVSRYNSWKKTGFKERGETRIKNDGENLDRHEPIWIIAGDFNFTPESEEYEIIQRMNFMDALPNKKETKTSGAGNEALLTVDYIFAGPMYVSLDPMKIKGKLKSNDVDYSFKFSDHYPLFAKIPIIL